MARWGQVAAMAPPAPDGRAELPRMRRARLVRAVRPTQLSAPLLQGPIPVPPSNAATAGLRRPKPSSPSAPRATTRAAPMNPAPALSPRVSVAA